MIFKINKARFRALGAGYMLLRALIDSLLFNVFSVSALILARVIALVFV